MGIQEKCYEWEKNWGEKPTGEQNSSQKTDDETAKKTAIDPTIDDCTVYCFFMYYWSDIFMQKIIFAKICMIFLSNFILPNLYLVWYNAIAAHDIWVCAFALRL